MGFIENSGREVRIKIGKKSIHVALHTAEPPERDLDERYQIKIRGITDYFDCVPARYWEYEGYFAPSRNRTVLWLDGFFSLVDGAWTWTNLPLAREAEVRDGVWEVASFNPEGIAPIICNILFPKNKDRSGEEKIKEAWRNALEPERQKMDWDPGENEGTSEANECDSGANEREVEGEQNEDIMDDLPDDNRECVVLDTTFEGGNYRLEKEVWNACLLKIHANKKKNANKLVDDDMQNLLNAMIYKAITPHCSWPQARRDYRILGINRLPRVYKRWVEIGVFTILVDRGVLEESQLPPCPDEVENRKRPARPKNGVRPGGRIKNQISETVWQACWLAIRKSKSRYAKKLDVAVVRAALEGIVDKLKKDYKWETMPKKYGYWQTLGNCYRRWLKAGVIKILVDHKVLEQWQLNKCPGEYEQRQRGATPEDSPPPRPLKIDLDGLLGVLASIGQIENKTAVKAALLKAAAAL